MITIKEASREDLKKLSTRQLLDMKNSCHAACVEWDPDSKPEARFKLISGAVPNERFDPTKPVKQGNQKKRNVYDHYTVSLSLILEELNTRPHVPNKQESRKIRQQNAKAKR